MKPPTHKLWLWKLCIFGFFLFILPVYSSGEPSTDKPQPRIPILYSSDLYHPHQDPDDHFDLVTLFAVPEFDIRAIVIDLGPDKPKEQAGIPPLQQIQQITGRQVVYSIGLSANLLSLEDTADRQSAEAQKGVELILQTLRESPTPVTLFTTGSLRDVAAAYNRAPDLFKTKVSRFYINAGHSGGGEEWNVNLDPKAYIRILRSGLPIYWLPCFGVDGYFSYWKFQQAEVIHFLSPPLQNFFLYALNRIDPKKQDPLEFLSQKPDSEGIKKIGSEIRSMWCTAAFLHAADRSDPTFSFEKVNITLDDKGLTKITADKNGIPLYIFHAPDAKSYSARMVEKLRELFISLTRTPSFTDLH